VSTTAVDTIVPTQTALLLMDFQPLILSQIADRDALLDNARAALHWAREHGVRVVFVRVAFAPEDYDAIPHHHKAFAAAKQQHLFADGDPALDITPELEVRPDDLVVRKTRYGAFSTTGLHAVLGDAAIDTLIVGGISTAGVVLSTVRDAADQDYRLFVLADATADTDPEVHRVLVDKVLPRQADMITTSTLPTVTPAA
jgi:nicotinamidase-related amidase